MRAIYKKELKSYFTSAIAWVFLAFFLVLTGLFFFLYNLSGGSLNFSTVYGAIEIFFILLLIPVLTMKSMADEKHQKRTSCYIRHQFRLIKSYLENI